KIANGIDLDWNLRRARAENIEVEFDSKKIRGRAGALKLLSFINHGNMGGYRQSIERFLTGVDPVPNIEKTRQRGRVKYGFGINGQQQVGDAMRVFARWGWNEGQHESFAYTEVDQTVSFGADYSGAAWRRKYDKIGAAFVSNGISKDHQNYLRLGGIGFLLGDGRLTYGRETIAEAYYPAHFWRRLFGSALLQHINNPGYNRDRGPVIVPGFRVHVEF
ncbi:MAG: carbohydrate porin, partial [Acidobacteriaceae bacterium]|nr:carbohydrate porin [Acidobacteriaceae bacterium]